MSLSACQQWFGMGLLRTVVYRPAGALIGFVERLAPPVSGSYSEAPDYALFGVVRRKQCPRLARYHLLSVLEEAAQHYLGSPRNLFPIESRTHYGTAYESCKPAGAEDEGETQFAELEFPGRIHIGGLN